MAGADWLEAKRNLSLGCFYFIVGGVGWEVPYMEMGFLFWVVCRR